MLEEFWDSWGKLIVYIGLFTLAGMAIDAVFYALLRRRAQKTHHKIGQEIARALEGLPTAVAIILGVRLGSLQADLTAEQLKFANQAILAASIVVATAWASRLTARVIRFYTTREDAVLPSTSIFVNLARAIVWLLGGLTLLAAFGISIAPILTAMGVGGIVIGLALQDTLNNLFSGIQVLLSGQVQPGDFIQLESGLEGRVVDVTWRNTTVQRLRQDVVIVPNAKLGSELVINFTQEEVEQIEWIAVGVAYDSDLEQVERVMLEVAHEVAKRDPGADSEHEPVFRADEFGDSSINVRVSMKAHEYGQRWGVQTEMIKSLHKRFAEEGIEIPFPQRVVTMAEGAEAN
jgi:small-conductance mechanosensitive channel